MSKNKGSKSFSKSIDQSNIAPTHSGISNQLPHSYWWASLIAIIITFICFSTAINNEFVNWDDDRNFYENPNVQHVTNKTFWENTKKIFQSDVIGNYNPLTIWTFAIEKIKFGFENPKYWHIDNILLHLICVFLSYRIALLLGIGWRGALFVALFFGIHPMRVESVAWVTERKDVLFGAFYLGALLQYIKWKKDLKQLRWLWILVLFSLSLLSKIQAVALPLSMILVDYYLDKSWTWKSMINKLPFFAMSIITGVYGIIKLKQFGSLASATDATNFNFIQRLFIGAYSFIIYLIKLIVPFELSPLYPYPNYFPWYFYVSMVIAPIIIYLLYWSYKNQHKAIFFGMAFFIVNIVFLLQILGAGQGFLADRFTYIAYFGLFFVLGYYFDQWLTQHSSKSAIGIGIVGICLAIFGFMTFQQNKIWQNSATLWTHVLKYYQNTTLPYGNRANYYRDHKMFKEALSDYNMTISMKDNQPEAYNSRARLFFELAKGRDTLLLALNDYNKAIEYDPKNGEFRINRGATYARLGDIPKAIEEFNEGLKLKPDHAEGYMNRSLMFQNTGQIELAIQDIESYLKLRPYHADLWYEKGRALRLVNRTEEAITAYSQAINLKSNNLGLYYYERSKANAILNKMNEAKSDLQQAIQLNFKVDPAYQQQLGM